MKANYSYPAHSTKRNLPEHKSDVLVTKSKTSLFYGLIFAAGLFLLVGGLILASTLFFPGDEYQPEKISVSEPVSTVVEIQPTKTVISTSTPFPTYSPTPVSTSTPEPTATIDLTLTVNAYEATQVQNRTGQLVNFAAAEATATSIANQTWENRQNAELRLTSRVLDILSTEQSAKSTQVVLSNLEIETSKAQRVESWERSLSPVNVLSVLIILGIIAAFFVLRIINNLQPPPVEDCLTENEDNPDFDYSLEPEPQEPKPQVSIFSMVIHRLVERSNFYPTVAVTADETEMILRLRKTDLSLVKIAEQINPTATKTGGGVGFYKVKKVLKIYDPKGEYGPQQPPPLPGITPSPTTTTVQ